MREVEKELIQELDIALTWQDGILHLGQLSMTEFRLETVELFSKLRVVQAVPLEYNVSNDVLAYYRQVVNQINFKKSGGAAADFSTGKITFVIKVD